MEVSTVPFEGVALTNVIPAGQVSVSKVVKLGIGPLFFTVIVKLTVVPKIAAETLEV